MPNRQSLDKAYPALAARQPPSIRSVVALALVDREKPLGGLLLYLGHEVGSAGLGDVGGNLKARVVRALRTVRTAESWNIIPLRAPAPGGRDRPGAGEASSTGGSRQTWSRRGRSGLGTAVCLGDRHERRHARRATLRPHHRHLRQEGGTVQVRHPTAAAEPPTKPPDPVDPLEIAGRGLALVDAVADAWGVEHEPGHTLLVVPDRVIRCASTRHGQTGYSLRAQHAVLADCLGYEWATPRAASFEYYTIVVRRVCAGAVRR